MMIITRMVITMMMISSQYHTVFRNTPSPPFDRIIAMIANEGIECIPLWARMLAWFIGGGAGSPQRMYCVLKD